MKTKKIMIHHDENNNYDSSQVKTKKIGFIGWLRVIKLIIKAKLRQRRQKNLPTFPDLHPIMPGDSISHLGTPHSIYIYILFRYFLV